MRKAGFRVALIPDAFVYHKRRTSLGQFFRQVQGFGRGRIRVGKAHPGEVKLTHWFPSFFLIALLLLPVFFILAPYLFLIEILGLLMYLAAIFSDALRVTKSMAVAALSAPAAIVQLCGYGLGFLKEKFK
jgi:GT2 family glycosyltransferase